MSHLNRGNFHHLGHSPKWNSPVLGPNPSRLIDVSSDNETILQNLMCNFHSVFLANPSLPSLLSRSFQVLAALQQPSDTSAWHIALVLMHM